MATWSAALSAAAQGRSSKCLVLDLDNTLWGGVIGDDGLDGIKLGQGSALGEAYLAFQHYARDLGAPRRHPGGLLQERRGERARAVHQPSGDGAQAGRHRLLRRQLDRQGGQPARDRATAEHRPRQPGFRRRQPGRARHQSAASCRWWRCPNCRRTRPAYGACIADAGYFEALRDHRRGPGPRRASISRTWPATSLMASATDMDGLPAQPGDARGLEPVRPGRAGAHRPAHQQDQPVQPDHAPGQRRASARHDRRPGARCTLQIRLLDQFGDNGIIAIVAGSARGRRRFGSHLADELPRARPRHGGGDAEPGRRRGEPARGASARSANTGRRPRTAWCASITPGSASTLLREASGRRDRLAARS